MFWISLFTAFGLAIILVEKGEDWPILIFIPKIKSFLHSIHEKMPEMLNCTVCSAFWTSLLTDSFLYIITGSYFLWPLTGFAASGLSWIIYQILNILEARSNNSEEGTIDVHKMEEKSEN